jgi:DNA (cytosine-5)-methyltransferase 1
MKKSRDANVTWKIKRLQQGAKPRLLDLFSGCGGISLGFKTAGYEIIGAVENDPAAAKTHGINFFSESHGDTRLHHVARDIHDEPYQLFEDSKLRKSPARTVDILVGGPPCQAFARVGRAKLRSEARKRQAMGSDRAFLQDERADLVWEYLRIVDELKPLAILIENVPDILNFGDINLAEEICAYLEERGYTTGYTLLNSVFYGVPQARERMFLLAYRHELGVEVEWPDPTHFFKLPSGYDGTRATALKHILKSDQMGLLDDLEHNFHHFRIPTAHDNLCPAITVEQALSDLPKIMAFDEMRAGRLKKQAAKLELGAPYTGGVGTGYAALMRSWPGYQAGNTVTGHVIRYLPRDYKIFREMKQGWQYPEIWNWVEEKRASLLKARKRKGLSINPRNSEVSELIREWTLPYDPGKFPNKWWKLKADEPSRTLLAHLGKDSYSHIHYDSKQARTISVREAARLQSFPDGFLFNGGMNAGFRQVGNAVPPLLAYAIAMAMRSTMRMGKVPDIRDQFLYNRRGKQKQVGLAENAACAT